MLKRSIKIISLALLIMALIIPSAFAAAPASAPGKSNVHKTGSLAYEHLTYLSNELGSRVAGSDSERQAQQYIENQFKEINLATTVQEFTYTKKGTSYSSANVISSKPGKSSKQVIVGAHYDSVNVGNGSDDNASGIGVMLEAAEVLKNIKTPYSIKFIAFGAEEVGLCGSNYYVSQMSKEEISNTVAMINLDSLAVGDKMYVYGDEGKLGWVRDQALNIASKHKLNLETNPGNNPDYPAGTTGLWSDHEPFVKVGIPYAYFESTNWEIGDCDGYTQTEKDGEIWHTEKDTIQYIEKNFPGRIEEHLSTYSYVLQDLLKFLNKTSTSKTI